MALMRQGNASRRHACTHSTRHARTHGRNGWPTEVCECWGRQGGGGRRETHHRFIGQACLSRHVGVICRESTKYWAPLHSPRHGLCGASPKAPSSPPPFPSSLPPSPHPQLPPILELVSDKQNGQARVPFNRPFRKLSHPFPCLTLSCTLGYPVLL
jgi:hypothetical protein